MKLPSTTHNVHRTPRTTPYRPRAAYSTVKIMSSRRIQTRDDARPRESRESRSRSWSLRNELLGLAVKVYMAERRNITFL